MFLQLLVFVVTIWIVQRRWYFRRQRAFGKMCATNMKSWPIIGHTHFLFGNGIDRLNFLKKAGRDTIKRGGITSFMHFDQPMLCIADAEVAQHLMKECLEKHSYMKIFKFVIGNGSFVSPVPIWRHRRKAMQNVFRTKNLTQFTEVFYKHATEMTNDLKGEMGKDLFSFGDYVSKYSITSACEIIMGVQTMTNIVDFQIALRELWEFGPYIACRPWLLITSFIPYLRMHDKYFQHRYTMWRTVKDIIKNKQDILRKKTTQTLTEEEKIFADQPSLLGQQLEAPEHLKFTDKELVAEFMTMLIGGYDTGNNAAAFVVLMLSRHLDVQDTVYRELLDIFGESDRAMTYEDLQHMKYLEAVIKETLRLYPVAPAVARHVDRDVVLPSGLTVVAGFDIFINIWAIHRNPSYWGADADLFRPERFLLGAPSHPAAFMPFSYGPRNCIGYRYAMISLKTVVSTLLRCYLVLPPPGVKQGDPLRTSYNFLSKHADGTKIKLQKRRTSATVK